MDLVDIVKQKSKRFLLWNKTLIETEIMILSDEYNSEFDWLAGITLGYHYFQARLTGEEKYKSFLEGFVITNNPKTKTAESYLKKLKQ